MSEDSVRIKSVESLQGHTLRVRWTNGKAFPVDLTETVNRLKGLRPLRDRRFFQRVFASEGGHSVEWPGELDIGAARLWELALEQNGRADAAAFIRWRWKHGLSLTRAAEALGISRRTVAYYVSGDEPVPSYILLACKGWEAEQREGSQASVA